jgi:hypothetical protein
MAVAMGGIPFDQPVLIACRTFVGIAAQSESITALFSLSAVTLASLFLDRLDILRKNYLKCRARLPNPRQFQLLFFGHCAAVLF